MRLRNSILFILLATLVVVGCAGQAAVTPPPTASVSNSAPSCPSGYTCGYIVSRATCTGPAASTCPTPGNPGPGPYTALQTPETALTTPNFTDPAPPSGAYVAYTEQVVYTNLSPAWTGAPSPISTPQLVPLYPGTLGAPAAVVTAALAPPIEPNSAPQQMVASNVVPTLGRPQVRINK